MSKNPKLSICCITFNHVEFIRKTLESFIMQKTDFPFEVIIHDDASTDGTIDVVKEFEKKYPDIIKPIYQTENQWSKGVNVLKNTFAKVRGEYVAICEGDDYWLDENKLQKQVTFLKKNPDFSISFHPVKVIWNDNLFPESVFPDKKTRQNKNILTLEDLLKNNFIQTNSVVYRWRFKSEYNDKIDDIKLLPDDILPVDWYIHILHAQVGKIGYMDDVMAVYWKHTGGIWFEVGKTSRFYQKCGLKIMNFYKNLGDLLNRDYADQIEKTFKRTFNSCLIMKDFDALKDVSEKYSDLYSKSVLEVVKPKSFDSKLIKYKIFSKMFFGKKKIKYEKKYKEYVEKMVIGLN